VLSLLELTIDPARPRFETRPAPRIYQALDELPPGIVAEYPLVNSNDRIIWQTVYRRALLNNAEFGSSADEARRMVLDPRAPGVAETLAFLGVTAIVTHPDALDYHGPAPKAPHATWGPGYELVARASDGSSVWRVVAQPAPALVTLTGGFGEPAPADGAVGYPLVSPAGIGTIEFTARAPSVVRLTFVATPPNRTQVVRLADDAAELPYTLNGRTKVSVPVEIPRGRSLILIKTDPAATSDEDAVVITRPRVSLTTESPELHATAVSPDPGF
jgi:hypothetical protein